MFAKWQTYCLGLSVLKTPNYDSIDLDSENFVFQHVGAFMLFGVILEA